MQVIHLQAVSQPPITTKALYEKDGYGLVVGPNGTIPHNQVRCSIGTLVLSFVGDTHIFQSLDGYTGLPKNWQHESLTLPKVTETAAVMCIDSFPADGIGIDDTRPVTYTYSKENGLLRIIIGKEVVEKRIQCFSSLICGLGKNSEIVEFWIQDIQGLS